MQKYIGQMQPAFLISERYPHLWMVAFLDGITLKCIVEYVRTGDGSDFWHVQDQSSFSDPYCIQTIGHKGY